MTTFGVHVNERRREGRDVLAQDQWSPRRYGNGVSTPAGQSPSKRSAFGIGIATVSDADGRVLDVRYPRPNWGGTPSCSGESARSSPV